MTTPAPHAPARRSVFVTALGSVAIGIGTLLVPVSGCAFLMVLAGGDGTSSYDVAGFLTVVAPPAALLAGIGLLRRRAWAWWAVVVLLLAVIGGNGWIVVRSLERDATWWPARRATQQRVVSRAAEPASFWLAIAVYAGVGLGGAGLALWGLHAGRRG